MKIELQTPFKEIWQHGYLNTRADNRKRVDLVNSKKDRTTISYARYLLSVKIVRLLNDDEEADHINADKTDDREENLQILSIKDHILKTNSEKTPAKMFQFVCANCEEVYKKRSNKSKFCSSSCNAKYTRSQGRWLGNASKITGDLKIKIEKLIEEGKTDYRIAKLLDIARSSVRHFRLFNYVPLAQR